MGAESIVSRGRIGRTSGVSICSMGRLLRVGLGIFERIYSIMFIFRKRDINFE